LFSRLNVVLLGALGLTTLLPFLFMIAQSFSSHRAIMSGEVYLWPVDFTLAAYKEVFRDQAFVRAFLVSVARTVAGSVLSVAVTCLFAYPLAKPFIRGRRFMLFLVTFTLIFGGGMIPTYLIVRELGLLNTFWAYLLPGAVSAFNVIIMKNFFQSVPVEIEESAIIDGCSNAGTLFRIVVPLSMPAVATIGLFHAVGHWNSFFDAVLYVNDRSLYPLQVYLRELIQFDESNIQLKDNLGQQLLASESLKAATLVATILPILIVYPFLQKYFVKGMMLGSVKG